MDLNKYTKPKNLLRYSFLWNEVRLVVAAISLIWGATPIFFRFTSSSGGSGLLTLSWLISGVAALYILYVWNKNGQKIFGGKNKKDMAAFWIAIISGVHLGLVPIVGNLGMSLVPSGLFTIVMIATGILYIWSAWHLYTRYKANKEKLF